MRCNEDAFSLQLNLQIVNLDHDFYLEIAVNSLFDSLYQIRTSCRFHLEHTRIISRAFIVGKVLSVPAIREYSRLPSQLLTALSKSEFKCHLRQEKCAIKKTLMRIRAKIIQHRKKCRDTVDGQLHKQIMFKLRKVYRLFFPMDLFRKVERNG